MSEERRPYVPPRVEVVRLTTTRETLVAVDADAMCTQHTHDNPGGGC